MIPLRDSASTIGGYQVMYNGILLLVLIFLYYFLMFYFFVIINAMIQFCD